MRGNKQTEWASNKLANCSPSDKSNYKKVLALWQGRVKEKEECCTGTPCSNKCPRYGL